MSDCCMDLAMTPSSRIQRDDKRLQIHQNQPSEWRSSVDQTIRGTSVSVALLAGPATMVTRRTIALKGRPVGWSLNLREQLLTPEKLIH